MFSLHDALPLSLVRFGIGDVVEPILIERLFERRDVRLGLFGPRLAGRGQHVDRDDRRQQPDDDDDDHQFDQSEAAFGETPQKRETVFGGTPTKSEAVFGGTVAKKECIYGGTSWKNRKRYIEEK